MDPKDLLRSCYRLFLTRPLPRTKAPLILWLVPLVGPKASADWGKACALLDETLASVMASGYENWALVLCCQERPPNLPDDPRIHFLQAPDLPLRKGVTDQSQKVRLMTAYAARTFRGVAYVSHLDADDLMHPDLPGWIAADSNGRGYLVDKGYMADFQSGRLVEFGIREGQRPFWVQCGSCGYFAVDFSGQALAGFYLRLIGKGHKSYAERCARLGRPLDPVPFPAMFYMVNHGDNVQARRGNDKMQSFRKNEVTDPAEHARVLGAFGLRARDPATEGREAALRGPFAVVPRG